ncbi:DUF1330 domain-containing protein [Paenibacillus puerhi]|uniref:DUF1330 domain-containing protein n=1 Tax=Paenibacillus puerhi TaxID=2692622 RepID=UPI00135A1576|nr:DUF1330 domain-containing protein [Paenibacillus puerhi]
MVWVLVTMTPNEQEPEALERYKERAKAVRDEYGAQAFRRWDAGERLVGSFPDESIRLLRFDNEEQVKGWLEDPRYAEVIPFREKAFASVTVTLLRDLDEGATR